MKLWVIKIGTSILRGNEKTSTENVIKTFCEFINNFILKGNKVVLVTSGAVGLGCQKLSLDERPNDLSSLQAAAAVGQVNLMALYEKEMNKLGNNVAQILITKTDFNTRESFTNASKTLKKLIEFNVIPIVNENDTISNEEIKYGDNDTLSALVSLAINANKLILLTDIDKLYSEDPKKNNDAVPIMEVYNNKELKKIKDKNNRNSQMQWGTGGITTKLLAAEIATNGGITVQLADGRNKNNLKKIFDEKKIGTIFYPLQKPIAHKKSWLAHAIHTVGDIILDDGACLALTNKGASLLLVGIIDVVGDFASNQPVRILNKDKKEIAKGITSLSSDSLKTCLKQNENRVHSKIVVHRDVLALT
tara:strand:+ start:11707 stop:12792 length:1086 start_codon:yes stop_codon:yes gene_type:complete